MGSETERSTIMENVKTSFGAILDASIQKRKETTIAENPPTLNEMLLLFKGHLYKKEELKLGDPYVDMALQTSQNCKGCMGIEYCLMPMPGWQTVYREDDSEAYGYRHPCFRQKMCLYWQGAQNNKKASFSQTKQTFASIQVSPENQKVLSKCVKYAESCNGKITKGLLVVSDAYKLRNDIAKATLNHILENNTPCVSIDYSDIIRDLNYSFETKKDPVRYNTLLLDVPAIINNVNLEPMSLEAKNYIHKLIETRLTNQTPTVLTTGLDGIEMKNYLGVDIVKKLHKTYEITHFN